MTAPVELLQYVQHQPRCEALEVMWHKGPCTCGLSELLRRQPEWVKKHLGPGAVACTTCGDKGYLGTDEGGPICTNCKDER